jgi:uncharacterized protein (TIGR02145 family)
MKAKTKIWLCPLILFVLGSFLFYSCKKDEDSSGTVTDSDGNIYTTITIDTLVWMVENLKTTKYSDGTSIPLVTDNDEWKALTTPGYCWYNNDIANKNTYGALYNFHVVAPYLNGDKNICPTGWYVPDFYEWYTLINKFGQNAVGGILKEVGTTHWTSPNEGATNESGFTALPGGSRSGYEGTFYGIGISCSWWASGGNTYYEDSWYFGVSYNATYMNMNNITWKSGCYIRCVKKK